MYKANPQNLELGSLLRKRRRALDLTQHQLAARIGMSHSWVCEVEKGHYMPTLSVGAKLAQALSLPLFALVQAAQMDEELELNKGKERK